MTDSDNGLLPGLHQPIDWTNTEILLIGPLGTNFSEIVIQIQTFSFKIAFDSVDFKILTWPQCVKIHKYAQ